MNESETNLLKVMAEFVWPDPPNLSFRLYYDDIGKPLVYTMEHMPGNYIEISREDFLLSAMDIRVIDEKIVHPIRNLVSKLRPSLLGTSCHPRDVAVVVPEDQQHVKWSLGSNEKDRYRRS